MNPPVPNLKGVMPPAPITGLRMIGGEVVMTIQILGNIPITKILTGCPSEALRKIAESAIEELRRRGEKW